jgi:hypothetical protein
MSEREVWEKASTIAAEFGDDDAEQSPYEHWLQHAFRAGSAEERHYRLKPARTGSILITS